MFCHKCKCCCAMWWSGFFGLAALAHLIRLVARIPLVVNNWAVPMTVSIGVAIVAGALSFFFCKKGCASCSCTK